MSDAAFSTRGAMEFAGAMSGQAVITATPARAGGNNRVFCVEMADGNRLALKYYPPQSVDRRNRLGQEYEALSFLARHGVTRTPRPVGRNLDAHCALYEWFDGEAAVLHPQASDVDQLAQFLIELQQLQQAGGAQQLRNASASIFSPAQALDQFDHRLHRLRQQAGDIADLREFLDRRLAPTATAARRRLEARYLQLGLDPATELTPQQRALSPSDFGLHNALRGADDQLRFIDFEYFGWDDPAKLVCDTALHPGSSLSESDARRFVEQLTAEFQQRDPLFAVRCDVLYPVFGVIWCLIILNDFLPESRSRRVMAGQDGELGATLAGLLDKSRRLHQVICQRDPDLAPR